MSRVFIENLSEKIVIVDKMLHYLLNVVKKSVGDELVVFDGKTGEFIYEITEMSKKSMTCQKKSKVKDFVPCLDVWLLFAPLKKDASDFVVQKATELGVKKIIPVITNRVNNHNFNQKRASLQAIEASEQCERLDVCEVLDAQKLDAVLSKWPEDRVLVPLLERQKAKSIKDVLLSLKTNKIAFLVGPEGGFDDNEKQKLSKYMPASMGQRILRAETAAISVLACYQALIGDFN